ncbi:hypothetical protein BT69DRAFT_1351021 [Atractiella rhizophila]|nr:hypothetical protein BT69DRAFT_1351021 [Atractiella rhizophila]
MGSAQAYNSTEDVCELLEQLKTLLENIRLLEHIAGHEFSNIIGKAAEQYASLVRRHDAAFNEYAKLGSLRRAFKVSQIERHVKRVGSDVFRIYVELNFRLSILVFHKTYETRKQQNTIPAQNQDELKEPRAFQLEQARRSPEWSALFLRLQRIIASSPELQEKLSVIASSETEWPVCSSNPNSLSQATDISSPSNASETLFLAAIGFSCQVVVCSLIALGIMISGHISSNASPSLAFDLD